MERNQKNGESRQAESVSDRQKGGKSRGQSLQLFSLSNQSQNDSEQQDQVPAGIFENKQFPFHLYLKETYDNLSLQSQINIVKEYFGIPCLNSKITTDCLLQMNSGINLFTKLPDSEILLIYIKDFNESNLIMHTYDCDGRVLSYRIFSKNIKKSAVIIKIKKRIERNSRKFLLFILDESLPNPQDTQKRFINRLANNFNFHYIQKICSKQHYLTLQQKLLETDRQVPKFTIGLDIQILWVYSKFCGSQQQLRQIRLQKDKYLSLLTKIHDENQAVIRKETICQQLGTRIYTLEALLINYIKWTGKSKEELMKNIEKIEVRHAPESASKVSEETDHYLERLMNCRKCKYCEMMKKSRIKKSKFKCMACSRRFKMDVPLCISCFGDFHEEVLPFLCNEFPKRLGKNRWNKNRTLSKKKQSDYQQCRASETQEQLPEEVKSIIIKLNSNMDHIKRIVQEMKQLDPGADKYIQRFYQIMLLNTLDCYTCLFQQVQELKRDGQVEESE